MNNRFNKLQKTTPKAEALLDTLRGLRAAQGRHDSPTDAMRAIYREAFRALQEANPATSCVAVRRHIQRFSKTGGAR